MTKIILYIATSLDGFIAKKNGSVDFLDDYQKDYGYKEFYSSINSIIMGNTTYEQVGHTKEFADYYKGMPIYVLTHKYRENKDNITFVNDLDFLKTLSGNVWMLGGAGVFNLFLNKNLIDEFIITIIPKVLGEGVPLFESDKEFTLKLVNSVKFDDGLVQLHYRR